MMRPIPMTPALALPLALTLAACDRPQPAPQPTIIVRSESQRRLFTMDEEMRRIGLKRAMQSANMPCPVLTRTGYVGRYKNMDMWTATCSDKRDWALFVGADDSVQVRLCADTQKVGLPSCANARPADGSIPRTDDQIG